jgi:hypothetical protein
VSESDQFRQYADEALHWVAQSKTEEEKRLMLELVRTWTEAAFASDRIGILSGSTPEARAP